MPGNLLNADISFPQFGDDQNCDDKIVAIQNYLYMLLEQLRYTLSNLGKNNINDAEMLKIADTLTLTGSINIADKFKVDHNGVMTWTSDNSPVAVQYSANSSAWHTTYAASDLFARYSYDGGQSWTQAIRIQGVNGDDASVPGYIKTSYIDSTKILSPEIYAGEFYATGQGRLGQPAYYIHNGCTISPAGVVTLGDEIGYISYDNTGAGTAEEAQERVFITTVDGVALKINASGNMSIQAQDFIYLGSELRAANGLRLGSASYGTALPPTGANGQLFFLLE